MQSRFNSAATSWLHRLPRKIAVDGVYVTDETRLIPYANCPVKFKNEGHVSGFLNPEMAGFFGSLCPCDSFLHIAPELKSVHGRFFSSDYSCTSRYLLRYSVKLLGLPEQHGRQNCI